MALAVGMDEVQSRIDYPEIFSAMKKLLERNLDVNDRTWEGFHAVLSKIKPH